MGSNIRSKPVCIIRIFLLTCLFFLIISGCSRDTDYKHVDFSEKISVNPPNEENQHSDTLRVAVAAMVSPKETIVFYRELVEYIGNKLGYNVVLVQRKTYGEINEIFPKGQIDMAFICTGPYVAGKEKYEFEALATPVVGGEPYYRSYIIVHRENAFQRFEDLRGRVFAFTDPDSNTGALVPKYWLFQKKENPNSFFKNVIYTYSHDNSIMAVAKMLVDAAAVDSHIWEYYNSRNPFYTSKTKVIKKSEPFGSPLLVASPHLSNNLKSEILKILLSMHEDPEGRQILKELMIDRFVITQDEWYHSVRKMIQVMQSSNKLSDAS